MRPLAVSTPTALLAASLIFAAPLAAQFPGISLGAGARYASPGGDLGDALDPGYGGYVKAEVSAIAIGAAAEASLTRFGGAGDADAVTVYGVQVGPRVGFGLLKVGLDIGWYHLGFDPGVSKTGYTPNVSVGLGPLEAGAGATFISGGRWLYLRAGLRF